MSGEAATAVFFAGFTVFLSVAGNGLCSTLASRGAAVLIPETPLRDVAEIGETAAALDFI
ncbi:MAG: hypothetical protein EOO54_29980 [Haliea sp.]|nr:MAG: hypothetical protein EOO54_29980 [Haliea sp.]